MGPIRIATFHLGRFDEAKLANRRVSDVLLRLLPRFDLVAVQGVRGKNRGVLVRLVEQLNAVAGPSGRSYDFATCPSQERDAVEHYSAFLFDRNRIEVDRTTVHFVEDRLNRFRTKPLVGAFRVRGPDPAEAFTFTLINVETDPEHTAVELDLLAAAYRAVRDDGRNEDDVILLGDLESDDQHLGQLGKLLGVSPLLSGVPTTVRGTQLVGQHPAGPPGHVRVHRPGGGGGHAAGVRVDHARGVGDLRAPARLGRVQRLRRRPGRPRGFAIAPFRSGRALGRNRIGPHVSHGNRAHFGRLNVTAARRARGSSPVPQLPALRRQAPLRTA